MMAFLIVAADQAGCACRARAARPAVCGVAIEVPDMSTPAKPVPMPAERIDTPGAVTSGLRWASGLRGPSDEKLAIALKLGLASVVPVSVTVLPSRPATVAGIVPEPLAPRNGMVTMNCSPVSGLEVMLPSNGGKPVALLIMSTAAAPAFCPKMARATRAQVPRWVTTSMPAVPLYSAGLQPRLTVLSGLRSTLTVSCVPLTIGAPLALMVVTVVAPDVKMAPGNDAVGSSAATEMVGDDDDASLDRVVRSLGARGVGAAEIGAERHVDDVHVVGHRPVDGVDGDVGRSGAAEHPDRVEVRLRRGTGADLEGPAGVRRRVVRPVVGEAAGQDAEAC